MNKKIAMPLLGLFSALTLNAAPQNIEKLTLPCETKKDLRTANQSFSNLLTLAAGGRSGHCFRIAVPAGFKNKDLLLHTQTASQKVSNPASPLKISGWFKGHGEIRFTWLCRDANKNIFYPFGNAQWHKIESRDAWTRIVHEYTPDPKSEYVTKIAWLTPALSVKKGSILLIDDIESEILPVAVNVKPEE